MKIFLSKQYMRKNKGMKNKKITSWKYIYSENEISIALRIDMKCFDQ